MTPFFSSGVDLICRPIKPEESLVGEVILQRVEGEIFAHRLLSYNNKIITIGDRSINQDPWEVKQILGVVVGFEKSDRRYFWKNGFPFKKIISFFLKKRIAAESKIYRKLILIPLWGFIYLARFKVSVILCMNQK